MHAQALSQARPGRAGPCQAWHGRPGRAYQANFIKNIKEYRPSFRDIRLAFSIVLCIMSALYSGII